MPAKRLMILKRLILNYVETRIDFGGVAPMDVGNLDFYDQWNDHQLEKEENMKMKRYT